MESRQTSGSKTLAELAKRLGSDVKDPIGYDPQTGRFYNAEDYAREKVLRDEAGLIWLLNFGQEASVRLTPIDEALFQTFVGMYTDPIPSEVQADELHKIAADTVADLRRFVIERTAWKLQLPRMSRVVTWVGSYPIPAYRTDDWKTAFRLRATELVCECGDRIRKCKRTDCNRLFFAGDKRQVFCSRQCSQKTQFENYVKSIGGRKAWRKKHKEQYHVRKKTRGVKTQARGPEKSP